MKVLIDLNELENLCRFYEENTSELAGIATDVKRKMTSDVFGQLAPYDLPGTRVSYEGDFIANSLMSDVAQLERLTLDMERLWAEASGLGGDPRLAGNPSSLPDLWWFQGVSVSTELAPETDAPPATGGGDVVSRIMATIRQMESRNQYDARNPVSTASGAYQFTNGTWGGFGGFPRAWLAPASVQDAKARANIQGILARYNNTVEAVPAAWYTGTYRGHGMLDYHPGGPGNPLTVQGYVDRWMEVFNSMAPAMAATTPMSPASSDMRQRILASARAWIGTLYGWGGGHAGPLAPHSAPVDCSGFVHQVFLANGRGDISGTARTIAAANRNIVPSLDQALPADLLFFGGPPNATHNFTGIHHIAIYVGNRQMIDAPHRGARVGIRGVYRDGFAGVRRVLA